MKRTLLLASLLLFAGCGKNADLTPAAPVPAAPEDELSSFLTELAQETDVGFSDLHPQVFPWFTELNDGTAERMDITGVGMDVTGVLLDPQAIGTFFENRGFRIDPSNLFDGTVAGIEGYRKEDAVCIVVSRSFEENLENPLSDYGVACGEIDFTDMAEEPQPVEEIFRKLFAEKYNRPLEAITITNTGIGGTNFARGSVVIRSGEEEGTPEGALFLAAIKDGKWVLVHDGNGGFACSDVEPYGFPSAMIEDCY